MSGIVPSPIEDLREVGRFSEARGTGLVGPSRFKCTLVLDDLRGVSIVDGYVMECHHETEDQFRPYSLYENLVLEEVAAAAVTEGPRESYTQEN